MRAHTVAAVLERLGVELRAPDLAALRSVYAGWCSAIPFDSSLKMIHVRNGDSGPLPGSTAESFFRAWLDHGTGGTCWAGNGALHDLLQALGFDVARAIATMLPSADIRSPNHGSVIVTLDGDRWIVDASILSGEPIRIPGPGEPAASGPLPRFEWVDGQPGIVWRMLAVPDGFPCRIERVGGEVQEWDAFHRRTADWSPFNYQLSVRLLRGDVTIGIASGKRFEFDGRGLVSATPLDEDGRRRVLIDEVGISAEVAHRVPEDSPVPPRPAGR